MPFRLLVRSPGDSGLRPVSKPNDLDEVERHLAGGAFLWLDMAERDPELLDELGERFNFDPAAIEDVLDVELLPKFDNYGDHMFVALHALTVDGDRLDTHEVDCFLTKQLLVTVHSEETCLLYTSPSPRDS